VCLAVLKASSNLHNIADVSGCAFAIQADIGLVRLAPRSAEASTNRPTSFSGMDTRSQKQETQHGGRGGLGIYCLGCVGDNQCGLAGGLLGMPDLGFARLTGRELHRGGPALPILGNNRLIDQHATR